MRLFAKWTGEQIELVCQRNDIPRPGKNIKPAWEVTPPHILREKITEEFEEMFHAFVQYDFDPTLESRDHLQWELADLAATAMMLSARIDNEMSKLRRGYEISD
jgi:NTP pyrophosphatase (non-canonical NTP hydrolase)